MHQKKKEAHRLIENEKEEPRSNYFKGAETWDRTMGPKRSKGVHSSLKKQKNGEQKRNLYKKDSLRNNRVGGGKNGKGRG